MNTPGWLIASSDAIYGVASEPGWLTTQLLGLVRFGAEWILWLLVALSLVSIAIMIERARFFRQNRADAVALRDVVLKCLDDGDSAKAVAELRAA
ncbi:MAG: hypothetical protein KC561_13360, partial [Myxococcales bacterium]|nr:hypothetical protein [Myxococcales bacterium]